MKNTRSMSFFVLVLVLMLDLLLFRS